MTNRREFLKLTSAATLAAYSSPSFANKAPRISSRLLPGTDESLPIVGLGNAKVFAANDVDAAAKVLDAFFECGGSYIDVSGSSRFTVGRLVAAKGEQQQSFLGNYLSGQNLDELRAEIRNLQTVQGDGPLDLSMKRDVADAGRRAGEFRILKEEGLLRHVGIGRPHKRFYAAMMNLIKNDTVDFVQVNYSMLEPEAAHDILPMARDNNVAVVINRPFINGDYFGIVKGHVLPDWATEFDCNSWAQFSLKYILSHPAVNCVLTETSNPKHVIDNLGAGFGELPDNKMRKKMREHLLALT